MLVHSPGRQSDGAISSGDHVDAFAEMNIASVEFQKPRFHDHGVTAQRIQLRADKTIYPKGFNAGQGNF